MSHLHNLLYANQQPGRAVPKPTMRAFDALRYAKDRIYRARAYR